MAALVELTLGEHEASCRGGEIIPATRFPVETSCRILVRARGVYHVIPGSKLRVKHKPTQNTNDVSLLPRSQIHRTRQVCAFQSCVCELPDSQSADQQHIGTLRECFQLVSQRARREW